MLAPVIAAGDFKMPVDALSGPQTAVTVATFLDLREFNFLHDFFRSAENTRPQFSIVDLTSACIALIRDAAQSSDRLILRARCDIANRVVERRMQVGLWPEEFAFLRIIQRSPANRPPYPRFDLGDLTTACVATIMEMDHATDSIRAAAQHRLAAFSRAGLP